MDDHTVLRDGLRRILEREVDLEVVGEAASGEAALELMGHARPDVVLMDVRMPGIDGIETTRRLRSAHPEIQVLVLSAYPEFTRDAIQAGAAGYLLKSSPTELLVAAVRAVALGSTCIQTSLLTGVPWSPGDRRRQEGALSDREVDILRLVARGLTNRSIAREIGIAPRTADQHVHNILVKIRAGSRTEAVRYAIEHDLALDG
ncbi:MAG TPA: response regulator transcription factor [Candidatus Dormibacteraeota bacterium]|nr:response regulator transcription factor [Candidatus Dormibacteraeota bacterium]